MRPIAWCDIGIQSLKVCRCYACSFAVIRRSYVLLTVLLTAVNDLVARSFGTNSFSPPKEKQRIVTNYHESENLFHFHFLLRSARSSPYKWLIFLICVMAGTHQIMRMPPPRISKFYASTDFLVAIKVSACLSTSGATRSSEPEMKIGLICFQFPG